MADRKTASAILTVVVGFGCMASVFWGRVGTGDNPARPDPKGAPTAPAPDAAVLTPRPETYPAPKTLASRATDVDRTLTTGAIGHDSALRKPNPLAYTDDRNSGPPILTGIEAVNYLAGNTLKREQPGKPARYTFFAARGIQGDGNERSFVASAWDRNRPDLCEVAADGTPSCQPITITLDGPYEFPGAKLGTVSVGGAAAVLLKGNVAKFPDYVPFLDEAAARTSTPPKAGSAGAPGLWAGFVGRLVSVESDDDPGTDRHILYYTEDNRFLDLKSSPGDAEHQAAVSAVVGHWHVAKTGLCQTRTAGDTTQVCFKPEALGADTLRLVPTGRIAKAQRVTVWTEAMSHQTAGP